MFRLNSFLPRGFTLVLLLSLAACHCGQSRSGKTRGANTDSVKAKFKDNSEIKQLSEAIQSNPNSPEVFYERANALLKNNDWQDAYNDLDRAIELDSNNVKYHSKMADMQMANGSPDLAIDEYEKILQLNPGDLVAQNRLAKIYYYQKAYQKSVNLLKKLIETNRTDPDAFFMLGMNYKEMKDTARAGSAFQTALQLKPDLHEAAIQLGLMASPHNRNLALQYFDAAIRIDTTESIGYFDKAKLYQDMEDYVHAKYWYRRAIIHNPQSKDAYFNLGWVYMQQDSLNRAKKYFTYAIVVEPQYAKAYYYRGITLEDTNSRDSAINDFNTCISLTKDNELEHSAQEELNRMGAK